MRSLLTLLACAVAALCTPRTPISVSKAHGAHAIPGSYIVTLHPGTSKASHLAWAALQGPAHAHISYADWDSTVLHGFAGKFSAQALEHFRYHPEVAAIEEDALVRIHGTLTTQTEAPWGLDRISHKARLKPGFPDRALSYNYTYDTRAGSGVDIYIIDTGINTAHSDFGGRARWGTTFGGYAEKDGNGHGTHVAGIALGTRFGVAKKANAIAVKVLDDSGSGPLSDVMSGINWAIMAARASQRPSVINLSLGSGTSQALDDSVSGATMQGVHVVVSAGNDNINAMYVSPAQVSTAVTVGSVNINDTMSWFSNYGACVDLYAPGEDITSAWIGSNTANKTLSGTSMSAPHVAGLMAYFTSVYGVMSPSSMASKLRSLGQNNTLHGIPPGTRDELAYNGDGR